MAEDEDVPGALIDSGELGPGDPLPSEAVLARRYGVAQGTARHALAELEGAGLVESVHGSYGPLSVRAG